MLDSLWILFGEDIVPLRAKVSVGALTESYLSVKSR